MFKTRVTEMLGIKYPIIQGGLAWLSDATLAAAVSAAGGLGIITTARLSRKEQLRDEIRKAKSLTDKPFGININLAPTTHPVNNEQFIEVLINEGVRIVETSGRSPTALMPLFKQGHVKVLHKTPGAVRFAQAAEAAGVDAISMIGNECGGHPGPDDTTSLVLIPATVAAVKVPVIAGGGIAEARGFVAAFALGAEAVLMGTRFVMTQECKAHPKLKEFLAQAHETDTIVIQHSIRQPARVVRNGPALKVQEMESRGASLQELLTIIAGEHSRQVYETGDINAGITEIGQSIGLVSDIPTVKEAMESIMAEAQEIIKKRLSALAGLS